MIPGMSIRKTAEHTHSRFGLPALHDSGGMWHLCHTDIANTLHLRLGLDVMIRHKLDAAFAKQLLLWKHSSPDQLCSVVTAEGRD